MYIYIYIYKWSIQNTYPRGGKYYFGQRLLSLRVTRIITYICGSDYHLQLRRSYYVHDVA